MKTLTVSYKDKQKFLKAYTSNISDGGLFIRTAKPLPKDEKIILKLQLPDLPQPLTIKSQVTWKKANEEGKNAQSAGMGLKFIEMSKNDTAIFQQFMKGFVRG